MKNIIPSIEQYYIQQEKNEVQQKPKIEILKLKLQTSKEFLSNLRLKIREIVFSDNN